MIGILQNSASSIFAWPLSVVVCENCKYAYLICQSTINITGYKAFAVCGNISVMWNSHMFLIDFVPSLQMKQMNNIVCNHFNVLTEVKGCSSYIVMVIDWKWGPQFSFSFSALCSVLVLPNLHVFHLFFAVWRKQTILWFCSCVLSVLSAAWYQCKVWSVVCGKLSPEFPFFITPHSKTFSTSLMFSLIISHICSPHRPACSMTSGPSPWRTNLAFHSGSKREVSLFCYFFGFHFVSEWCFLLNLWNVPLCW